MKKAIRELKNRDQMKASYFSYYTGNNYYSGYSGIYGTAQIFPK